MSRGRRTALRGRCGGGCAWGTATPWLDEIWALRTAGDGFEAALDIWSVALTAALKDPDRKETASTVLARLHKLTDQPD